MFWYNGKLSDTQTLELSIDDPALLYGATVFTTLRIYNHSLDSTLTNWQAHCDRLNSSLQFFGWQQPNWHYIRKGASLLISQFPILRITIFPDGREWIIGRFLPPDLTKKQKYGVEAMIAARELTRSLPSHKTGNYLAAWMAKNNAEKSHAQEAILVDAEGNWLETSTGNLWGWYDDQWWTPPVEVGILPGVMRLSLINYLQPQLQQEPWTPKLVEKFQAIAYSNSVVEIVPIHTVSGLGRKYNPQHPSFQKLRNFFQD
jgi:4-amino-4-deoxychorismate lyase